MRSSILLVAFLIACGGERATTNTIEPADPRPAPSAEVATIGQTPFEATAGSPITDEATEPDLVQIGLHDGRIEAPSALPRGETPLHVVNRGTMPHALVVEGAGVRESVAPLAPGQTFILQVLLDQPSVTLSCPLEGHNERATIRMHTSD